MCDLFCVLLCVLAVFILLVFLLYSLRYAQISRNISTASQFNQNFKDEVDLKNNTSHKVLTSDPALYNLMAREYQYDTEEFRDLKDPGQIYTSSSAVVHLIDRPLLIEK